MENGSFGDSVSSSLQVWFDTEVLEAHECDNLDAIATTVQHSRTAFRSDVQIEPLEEVLVNSESIMGVGTRKVERKFAVRNVAELVVDAVGSESGTCVRPSDRQRETRERERARGDSQPVQNRRFPQAFRE